METERAHDVIRRLRAKAESSTFPEEAETFRAKAERLAEKYGEPAAPRDRYRQVSREEWDRHWARNQRRAPWQRFTYERRRTDPPPDPGVNETGGLTF